MTNNPKFLSASSIYKCIELFDHLEDTFEEPTDGWSYGKCPYFTVSTLNSSICLELLIKVLWEYENGRLCEDEFNYTHNICKIYDKLECKNKIEELWKSKIAIIEEFERQTLKSEETKNYYQKYFLVLEKSFRSALKLNENLVRDFKYDGLFPEQCFPFGIFLWAKDSDYMRFKDINGLREKGSFIKGLYEYVDFKLRGLDLRSIEKDLQDLKLDVESQELL